MLVDATVGVGEDVKLEIVDVGGMAVAAGVGVACCIGGLLVGGGIIAGRIVFGDVSGSVVVFIVLADDCMRLAEGVEAAGCLLFGVGCCSSNSSST